MKHYLPLLLFAVTLVSCSTAYKTGQTPDDVYYSPARPQDEYVQVKKKDDRRYQGNDEVSREDRYLRMRTTNRRYSLLDDCDCYCYGAQSYYRYNDYHRFNSYAYFNNSWNNTAWGYYNPYYYNPYYSNPYYSGYVVGNVRPVYNKPRTGSLGVYNGGGTTNAYVNTPQKGKSFSTNSSDGNYRNSGTNAGGFLRNTFGGSNSSSNSSSSGSSSSSSSGSSSRSSGSSGGSTSAPARKF